MKATGRILIAATSLLASVAAAPTSTDPLPTWHPGIGGDLAFESSAFLRHTAYQKPDKTADQVAPSGASGSLHIGLDQRQKDHWLIEEQRYAIDTVIAGISYHRQDPIDRGERFFY